MYYVSFIGDKYIVGCRSEKAHTILEVSKKVFDKLNLGCTIDINGNITETEEYQKNVLIQSDIKEANEVGKEYSQNKINKILVKMVKEIYNAQTQTAKDKIDVDILQKFTDLKDFLYSKTA